METRTDGRGRATGDDAMRMMKADGGATSLFHRTDKMRDRGRNGQKEGRQTDAAGTKQGLCSLGTMYVDGSGWEE